MLKKLLIIFLFLYIFYSDILISLSNLSSIKLFLSFSIAVFFGAYILLHLKTLKNLEFLIVPILLILIFVAVWPELGYINLFYTVIFGWILCQDIEFSKTVLKITFVLQFVLICYERFTKNLIYQKIVSGVVGENSFDYSKNLDLFDVTGFRPKGLFPGTLIASSFVLYLVMLYRNNIKMLTFLFIMSLIVNARLAIVVSGFTLFFKLFKKYDIKLLYGKLKPSKKIYFFIIPFALIIGVLLSILPKNMSENLINTFDLNSTANAGRIFAYLQAILTFANYILIQKLFGSPGNEVYDIYDRVIASESGLLSMLLDIGIIGFLYYMYYFMKAWRSEKSSFLSLKTNTISFKYVVLITFLSFFQYEHINGNLRGSLFWFMIISQLILSKKFILNESSNN